LAEKAAEGIFLEIKENMSGYSKDCWPTTEQSLLLRAALLKGPAAIDAWEQWAELVDFNDIDYGSQRLLPLLHRNLVDHSIQSPLMARYKGFYRRFWMSNQVLFDRTKSVLSTLHDAGIEALLLKGAALVINEKLSYGLRPMDDIDFLVRENVAQEAYTIILELGWQPKLQPLRDFDPLDHAAPFDDGKGHSIDLHWRSLAHDLNGSLGMGYWERSSEAEFGGIPIRVMGATDQLIHTCVHGIHWNPVPPIRWIADATMILRNPESQIRWDHLIMHSKTLRVSLQMFQGLRYLETELGVPIPDYVLESLETIPVSLAENFHHGLSVRKPLPVVGVFTLKLTRYWAYYRKQHRFPGFLRYLQNQWNVRHLWQVPFEGVLRMWRMIRIDLFQQSPGSVSLPSKFQK